MDCTGNCGTASFNLIAGVFGEEEGDMLSLYGKNDAGNLVTYQLSKQEAVEKTELVYGTFCLDNDVHEQIIAYNQQNPDYYITVRLYGDDTIIDYYEYYDDQKLKLQAELASGTAPDILDMYSIREYVSYAEKGYLEDLTDYLMQLDSSEELFWRVLDAYSVNGKHCVLLPFFSIAGIVLTPEQTNRLAELGMDWNMEHRGGRIKHLFTMMNWRKLRYLWMNHGLECQI